MSEPEIVQLDVSISGNGGKERYMNVVNNEITAPIFIVNDRR